MTDIPLLLRTPRQPVVLSSRSLDFQTRVGRPGSGRPGHPTPCVLLLSRAADREADAISLSLAAVGVPVVRIDSDACAGLELRWDGEALAIPEGRYAPVVTLARYFTASSVARQARHVRDDQDEYVRAQWVAWSRTMLANRGVLNRPASASPLERLTQLAAAREVGLRVPATVVATNPAAGAAQLPGDGDLIVKSLGDHYVEPRPGQLRALFATRLSRAAACAAQSDEPAPVILQEFIAAERELRIYAVGGALIAFQLGVHDPETPFRDLAALEVASTSVPAELRRALEELVRRWRLDVAAFDVLDTESGPVFLEVNTACDWLYLERRAGVSPVNDAVTALLHDKFRSATQ